MSDENHKFDVIRPYGSLTKTDEKQKFTDELKAWQTGAERQALKDAYWDAFQKQRDGVTMYEIRQGIIQLFTDLDAKNKDGLTFFDQPASTKFHGNSLGGLARHCLEVYKRFDMINKEEKLGIPEDSVIIISLLHDLCKWNLYHPKVTVKGFLDERSPFQLKSDCPLGHGEMSISKIQDYIRLADIEKLLIRWHMAPYDYEWKTYQNKVREISKAVEWFFIADYSASLSEGSDDE